MNGEKFQDVITGGGNKNWTEDLPICGQTGCGNSTNQAYSADGRMKEMHNAYEKKCYCSYDSEK